MRIAVLGGGPAGLYFAYLWKNRHRASEVLLLEQNPADATWGFGVVFSDRALDFLAADDPDTAELITPHLQTWSDLTLVHRGEQITIDSIGFSAIGRLELLQLLQRQAEAVGVDLRFNTTVSSIDRLADFDLIVGADGVNSLLRRAYEGDFKSSLSYLDNKFIWFGTTQTFETLTQTFLETPRGFFNAHHYRYSDAMSTFIIECDRATWLKNAFDRMNLEQTKEVCEKLFADTLVGHELVSNKSVWRNFPNIWNERWSFQNKVLVGDALHTAHFSIGSGTRLALEDVIALVKALEDEPGDLAAGLQHYESARRPVVEKLVAAARASAAWYERFPEHMRLAPLAFAYSYITRSGRVDHDRLRALAPNFMAAYDVDR